MIPHYEKRCAEIAFRSTDAKKLYKVLATLGVTYRNTFDAFLSAVPGKGKHAHDLADDLNSWLKGPKRQPLIPGMYVPKGAHDPIIIVQLQAMELLESVFGKKFHKKDMAYLLTYSFSSSHTGKESIDAFHDLLAKEIASVFRHKKSPPIVPIFQIHRKVEDLEKKPNSTPPITAEQLAILPLLEDRDFRNTIIRTRQAKDPTLVNITKSTGLAEATVKQHLEKALEHGLITRKYNAICKSCSTALARVPNAINIKRMADDETACPKCKTRLTDDSFEECFTVEPKAGAMLDGSKWMCMYVRHHLSPFVASGRILTGVIDGPNELDLVANVDGSLVLAELKDAPFSIGHAYSFVGKCSQYRPDIPIVCTTDKVDSTVKDYLSNTGIAVHYIEGISDIQSRFADIFSRQHVQSLVHLLSEIPWLPMLTRQMMANFGEDIRMSDDIYPNGIPSRFMPPGSRWRR